MQAFTFLGLRGEVLVGLTLLLVLTAYAVLAGADFGGGIWDLLAAGPRREEQRQTIAHAIGPVWEANHVWLIFLIVILFMAFPTAYAALSVALFVPFHLVLAGIVLRGAAFVFRAHYHMATPAWHAWARVFGSASIVTPSILGATLSAVASGGIRVANGAVTVDPALAWFSPVSLLIGALTLAVCAYLAAVYLTVETRGALQADFRAHALHAWWTVALLPALLLVLVYLRSHLLWQHFARLQSLPPMAVGAVLALLSGWAVFTRRFRLARVLAVGEVIILLWGWAFAQWPYLVYPDLSVWATAAPARTLRFLLATLPFGFALLLPSLWLLFKVFKSGPDRTHP